MQARVFHPKISTILTYEGVSEVRLRKGVGLEPTVSTLLAKCHRSMKSVLSPGTGLIGEAVLFSEPWAP